MKKTIIRLASITIILSGCFAICYFFHASPVKEFTKFIKNKKVNYVVLAMPLIALALTYFACAIDWVVLFASEESVSKSQTAILENSSLLKVNNHAAEIREAEVKLMSYTNRSLADETMVPVAKKVEPLLGGKDNSDEYIEAINDNINTIVSSDPEDDDKGPEVAVEETPKVYYEPDNFEGAGFMPVSQSYDYADTTPAVEPINHTSKLSSASENTDLIKIAAILPEPLDLLLSNNIKAILATDFVIDERDRLDIIQYVRSEKSFKGSAKDLANEIIGGLEVIGRAYVAKQEVAALLESDNPALITEKRSNTIKERVRKQLLESADIQHTLLKRN